MKKMICGMTALTLMSATVMSVSAETVTPIGGDPFDITPNPVNASIKVEFSIDPSYTVTIPQKVELTGAYGTVYTGSGEVTTNNESVFLHEGEKLVVSLASDSKFNMSHEATGEYKLPYTASTEKYGEVDKENGGTVAEFPTSKTGTSVTIDFATDEIPQYAGKYSDTVTFNIALEEDSETPETPDTADVAVESLSLDKTEIPYSGDSLTVTVDPADATDGTVIWKIPDVAHIYSDADHQNEIETTIDGLYKYTAPMEAGTVYLTRDYGSGSDTVTVISNADDTKTATCEFYYEY